MEAKIDLSHPYSAKPYIDLMNQFGEEMGKLLGVKDSTISRIKFACNRAIMQVLEEEEDG